MSEKEGLKVLSGEFQFYLNTLVKKILITLVINVDNHFCFSLKFSGRYFIRYLLLMIKSTKPSLDVKRWLCVCAVAYRGIEPLLQE